MQTRNWKPDEYARGRLDQITREAAALREAEERIGWYVTDLRSIGVPWHAIGQALGITRQAAQQRFRAR